MRYHVLLCAVFVMSCGSETQQSHVSSLLDGKTERMVEGQWWDGSAYKNEAKIKDTDLYQYYKVALKKKRPTRIFKEIFASGAAKKIKIKTKQSWNTFYYNPFTKKSTLRITGNLQTINWFGLYNELFHAWHRYVFTKSDLYKKDRAHLFSSVMLNRYKLVHRNKKLAQEEAMSENFAGLESYIRSFFVSSKNKYAYYNRSLLGYRVGFTVTSDSHHSDNPDFHKTLKPVYISRYAYKVIFKLMTGVNPL